MGPGELAKAALSELYLNFLGVLPHIRLSGLL